MSDEPHYPGSEVERAAAVIARHSSGRPIRFGIVLGSGLGPVADALSDAKVISYRDIPGFPRPTVEGHIGKLHLGELAGASVAVMQGRAHYYEYARPDAMRVPIQALHALGCEVLLLTNAAGGLMPEAPPGSLMMISDHINLTGTNPLVGQQPNEREGLEVFVDMVNAYDLELRALLAGAAEDTHIKLHEGVYACFSGPSFETPAEIRAARVLGADAVGMSTVPEAILARQCGMRVAALSVIVNFAAGISAVGPSHEETMTQASQVAEDVKRLTVAFLARTKQTV